MRLMSWEFGFNVAGEIEVSEDVNGRGGKRGSSGRR
jgi:hypothetical protein